MYKMPQYMQQPKTDEVVVKEPVAVAQVAVEPVAVEPVAVEPVAVEPVAVETLDSKQLLDSVTKNFNSSCKQLLDTIEKFDHVINNIIILENQGFAISSSKNDMVCQKQEFMDILSTGLTQVDKLSAMFQQKAHTIV